MCNCEQHQMRISALVDGELQTNEQLDLMDHLLACPDCARFYNDVRSLQLLAERMELASGRVRYNQPEQGVRTSTPLPPFWHRLWPLPVWSWVTAAAVVVVIGLWMILPSTNSPGYATDRTEGGDDVDVTVVIDGDGHEMTEDRFVTLAIELLRAGPRYQDKMAEVLQLAGDQRILRFENAL